MKKYIFALVPVALLLSNTAIAAVQPIPNIDIILKRECSLSSTTCDHKLISTHTDESGKFSASNLVSDIYEIYYSDESKAPIAKVMPTNGVISGKISVEFYNQNSSPIAKKDTAASKFSPIISSSDSFVYGVWDVSHILKLKNVLIKESVLPMVVTVKTIDDMRSAIKLLQKKYGIAQTGTLGPTTIKKLNTLISK